MAGPAVPVPKPAGCAADPGFVGIRRLTRAELDNAFRDLLGEAGRPARALPNEDSLLAGQSAVCPLGFEKLETIVDRVVEEAWARETGGQQAPGVRLLSCALSSETCARTIIAAFARKAFRRPVAAAELDPLVASVTRARMRGEDAGGEAPGRDRGRTVRPGRHHHPARQRRLGWRLALVRGHALSIVDTHTATAETLPDADLRDDGHLGPHRATAFDATGARMLYLRGGAKPAVVVRDLASGYETTFDPGTGYLWSAAFHPDGKWLRVTMVPSGTEPKVFTTLGARQCRGEAASYSVFGPGRPINEVDRYLPLNGGRTLEGTDLVTPFGDGTLVRTADGALAVRDARNGETTIVPAHCRGRLVHADPLRRAIIAVCQQGEQSENARLLLFSGGEARDLGDWRMIERDRWDQAPQKVVNLGDRFVDMDARTVVPTPKMGASEVRATLSWAMREAGVYAERSDGAQLTLDTGGAKRTMYARVFRGPLRWRPRKGQDP